MATTQTRDDDSARAEEAMIDETLAESFPASDPPSWTLGREPQTPLKPPTMLDSVLALDAIVREMRTIDAYRRDGHTARTIVREPDLRVVLVAMKADSKILEHRADETACIHTLVGHVRLRLSDEVIELPTGQLLGIGRGIRHDVTAAVDSAFLLTLGWPARR